jgi:hypothetical protein
MCVCACVWKCHVQILVHVIIMLLQVFELLNRTQKIDKFVIKHIIPKRITAG